MSAPQYRAVGFIGLGTMGYPMAQNLARKLPETTRITVYDVNTRAIDGIVAEFPGKVVAGKSGHDVFSQSVSSSTGL